MSGTKTTQKVKALASRDTAPGGEVPATPRHVAISAGCFAGPILRGGSLSRARRTGYCRNSRTYGITRTRCTYAYHNQSGVEQFLVSETTTTQTTSAAFFTGPVFPRSSFGTHLAGAAPPATPAPMAAPAPRAPVTPAPVSPAPAPRAPVTPAPVSPAPVTRAPVSPVPVNQPAGPPGHLGCWRDDEKRIFDLDPTVDRNNTPEVMRSSQ